MKHLPIIFLSLTSPALAAADTCISIENDLDRLGCYDAELGRTSKREAVATSSDWTVEEVTSKMTDQVGIYASTYSTEPSGCRFSDGQKVMLGVRCKEGVTSFFFHTGCHMTSKVGAYGTVEFRMDSDMSEKIEMTESTDNKALGFWDTDQAARLAKWMKGHRQMTVRMTPYNESPFISTFNIEGAEDVVARVRKACKW